MTVDEVVEPRSAEAVAAIVRPYLQGVSVGGFQLDVVPERTRLMEGWWKVAVQPSGIPDRLFPLYEELAVIEERLRDDGYDNIVLSLRYSP
ncbi:MAG: hypothetical protein OHK0029_43200 [Armatimonadaceae bacterium]